MSPSTFLYVFSLQVNLNPKYPTKNKSARALVSPDKRSLVQLMKSFFDFNSWTEATRGARRWSWTWINLFEKVVHIAI
jgi:hypothetical protein